MVTFQDVVVPADNLLGSPGDGFKSTRILSALGIAYGSCNEGV